jgi:hypothetical protein
MASYHVSWEIEVDADSPEEAAQFARESQSPDTEALHFIVTRESNGETTHIDLG